MSQRKRKFFSGTTIEQAVIAAASEYGLPPAELSYRRVEKKHGFLHMRRRVVIEVDPESPRRAEGEAAPLPPVPVGRPRSTGFKRITRSGEGGEAGPDQSPAATARSTPGNEKRAERDDRRRADRPRPERDRADRARPDRDRPARGRSAGDRHQPERRQPDRRQREKPLQQAEDSRSEDRNAEESKARAPRERGRGDRGRENRGVDERGGDDRARRQRHDQAEEPRGDARGRAPQAGKERADDPRAGARRPVEADRDGAANERADDRRSGRPAQRPPRGRKADAKPSERRVVDESMDVLDAAEEAVDKLLAVTGLELDFIVELEGDHLDVDLEGPDAEMLRENQGKSLFALELLIPILVRGLCGQQVFCHVDSEGFRARREEELRKMALRLAEEVAESGDEKTLDYLNPAERRIVHMALADHEDVETESEGRGYLKRLTIWPL